VLASLGVTTAGTGAAAQMRKPAALTGGIADGFRCVGLIRRSPLPTRNRLAFLTLDSLLEISIRTYLKHRKRIRLDPVQHRPHHMLMKIARDNIKVDDTVWEHLEHCYEDIRCPLYHEASDMTVTDAILDDYLETVGYMVQQMFGMDAAAHVSEGEAMAAAEEAKAPAETAAPFPAGVDPNRLPSKVDAIVLALGLRPAKDSGSILNHLRSLGFTGKLTTSSISAYLSRGGYFYKDPEDEHWKLTAFVGQQRFQLTTGSMGHD
jgi:hypothetical protein